MSQFMNYNFKMQIFIDTPQTLLKQVWKDHNIHIVQKEYTLSGNRFCLIDISTNAQGQDQDKMYMESTFYKTNIRRGNTLVQITENKSRQNKKIMWGRKGTEKMVDVRLEYLQSVTREIKLSKGERRAFDFVFQNANRCLSNGKRVQIVKTQKVNGQKVQISYFYQLDAWLICSKDVSMLACNLKDFQIYQGKCYSCAKQIGKQWFAQIDHLSKQQIKKLKKLLDGFTLIGAYCGNAQSQHLIQHNEVKLIWFALVDNYTQEYCVDPFEVKKDIQQLGFRFVKVKRLGSFSDKRKFYAAMQDLYIKIAEASIEDIQYGLEGSIVYFLSPQMKGNKPFTRVLGSGKMKTIQYRYFRKILEKLSRLINRKQSQHQLIKKYQVQCYQLQKSNNSVAPFPQEYYTKVLKKGCELVKEAKITVEFLEKRFLAVLKTIFYCINKQISLKSFGNKLMANQNFMNDVIKIPLYTYGPLGCNTQIIYISIDLPKTSNNRISHYLCKHFNKLDLFFKQIQLSNSNKNKVQNLFNQINIANQAQENQQPYLKHFYIQGIQMTLKEIVSLFNKLKYKGKGNVYHKIVLVMDQLCPSQQNFNQGQNEYPFTLQNILASYLSVYKQVKNTPTIQEKINNFQKVTKVIKIRENFMEELGKQNWIKRVEINITTNFKIQQKQKNEIKKIVSCILTKQKQYQNYCRLILKLDKLDKLFQAQIPQKSQDQINNEIKQLIKSSFYKIPQISFSK